MAVCRTKHLVQFILVLIFILTYLLYFSDNMDSQPICIKCVECLESVKPECANLSCTKCDRIIFVHRQCKDLSSSYTCKVIMSYGYLLSIFYLTLPFYIIMFAKAYG